MSRFQNIKSLVGEEKPGLICSALKCLCNLSQSFVILPVVNDATYYNLQYGDKMIPYQICDSSGSSPDLIIKYEEGPNDFIEITKVKRHQSIYNALSNTMNNIHALSIQAFTLDEFNKNPVILNSPDCSNK